MNVEIYLIPWPTPHTHIHANTCSINHANVGSTGGRLLLKSSRMQLSHLISCPPWLQIVSAWGPFPEYETAKSYGARSTEYSGWMLRGMFFSARNCFATNYVMLSALLRCRNHCPCHVLCHFLRTASHNLSILHVVQTHGLLNCQYQIILGMFWPPLIYLGIGIKQVWNCHIILK
jgi:hypothetical protein